MANALNIEQEGARNALYLLLLRFSSSVTIARWRLRSTLSHRYQPEGPAEVLHRSEHSLCRSLSGFHPRLGQQHSSTGAAQCAISYQMAWELLFVMLPVAKGRGGGNLMAVRWQSIVLTGLLFAFVAGEFQFNAMTASAATNAGTPAISWLAAGDSYASGQGLTHTTEPCADGTGQKGLSTTWAIAAAAKLRSTGWNLTKNSPELVACTGAISADLLADNSKELGITHRAQWTKKMGRFNLVTFSFGGDDLDFASIIGHCETSGCPSDKDVRAKISAIATTGLTVKGVRTQSYPTFLDEVAKQVVTSGGNLVVMGYPELVEDVGLWSPGRTTCAGMSAGEVQRVRGWAGDLNATIGAAVAQVDALPADQRNDVHVTFIDNVTGQSANGIALTDPNLFEPSNGARHELCSLGGAVWMNGLSPLHIKSRSFHPNQAGETAMGALAAEVIRQLAWPWTRQQCSASAISGATGTTVLEPLTCIGAWALAGVSGQEGQTLFQQSASQGWILVAQLGDAFSTCALDSHGVPPTEAVALLQKLGSPPWRFDCTSSGSPATTTTTTAAAAPCAAAALAASADAWNQQNGQSVGGSTIISHACIDGYAEAIGEVDGSGPGGDYPLYFKDDGSGSWQLVGEGNPTSTANTTGVPDSVAAQLNQTVLNSSDSQPF